MAKPWASTADPRVAARPTMPANFALLEATDVRADLKLTEAESQAFPALADKWQNLAAARRTELSPKEADAQAAVLKADSDKALAALKPEQVRRLKQIGFQNGVGRAPHIEDTYTDDRVTKELTITADQRKEFEAIRAAFEKDAAAVLVVAENPDTAGKRLTELADARRTKADGVLTAEQAGKWKDLVGAPFTGSTTPDRLAAAGGGFGPGGGGGFGPGGGGFGPGGFAAPQLAPELARSAQFGKYATEFSLLATNKSVQDELKLTAEQITSARATQAEITRNHRIAVPREGQGEQYTKAYEARSQVVEAALSKLLTADQAGRFRQIMMQFEEQRPAGPSFVAQTAIRSAVVYPGVAEAVKLTEDQKKKLFAGTAPAEVLTDAQKTAVKDLLGEPFKGDFAVTPAPAGPAGGPGPGGPALIATLREATFGKYTTELNLLARNTSMQDELKLTADQIKKAADKYAEVTAVRLSLPTAGDEEAYAKATSERSKITEEALGQILTADQAKRFRQIMLQSVERTANAGGPFGALRSAAGYPGVAEAVNLTEDQKKKLLDGTAPAEVLTDAQKTAIKDMLGEPFKGTFTVPFGSFGPGGTVSSSSANAQRHATFGNHTSELDELASNASIQEELKLSPEQVKTAAGLRDEVARTTLPRLGPGTVENYRTAYTERSKAVAAGVTKVLDEKQAKRFREIMLQSRERAGTWVPSAVSYPGVADVVKLTEDQRLKMVTGTAPAEVLTEAQKTAVKDMLGEPFKGTLATAPRLLGGFGPGGPGGPGGFQPGGGRGSSGSARATTTLQLLQAADAPAAEALKLTDEQSKKLVEARETYQKALGGEGGGFGVSAAQRRAATEAFEKAVTGLLTDRQKPRFEELILQHQAATNLNTALTGAEVAKKLELTPEQAARLAALWADGVRLQTLRTTHLVTFANSPEDRQVGKIMRDRLDERLLQVLTEGQRAKWKELTGEPLKGLQKTIPTGGFGPGGGGGGFAPGGFGNP